MHVRQVWCAPAFGEDDYRVCLENQIIIKVITTTFKLSCCIFVFLFHISLNKYSSIQGENLVMAVDDDGCFTKRITDFSGRYVKEADKDIILAVKASIVEVFIKNNKLLRGINFFNILLSMI